MMKNRFIFATLTTLFFSISALADLKDDLYGENEAHKTYFDSFVMNCSQRTPQCVERETASESEEGFNQIFIQALDRDMQEWPNGELSKLRLALKTRENADSDFASGFFGNAAEKYQDATNQISKLLDEADIIVAENIDIGEAYLYDENRPDWAVDYFNEALIYAPNDPKVTKALNRIKFLQSFDEDVKTIQEMIEMRSFDEAVILIDDLLQGDPRNETLLALKKSASEGELGIKIGEILLDFQDQQAISYTEAQKEELLSKIANSLSLYGYNELTKGIQELKATLEEDLFKQKFDSLENDFINNSLPIEDLFIESQKLLIQYPRQQDVVNLSQQIKQKRSLEILGTLRSQASAFTTEEQWEDVSKTYSEIYLITNDDLDKKLLDANRTLIKRLSSLKQITNEPTNSLNTQDKIESARWLLKELKEFSSSDTPVLNVSIIDFEQLIDSYQALIKEDANRKKNKVASNSNAKKPSPNAKKPSPGSSTNSSESIASGAKLDMASFISNVVCTKKIRNKEMSTQFEITVLSSGRASNVRLLNADDLNLNTRDKETIDIISNALKSANYIAAKSGGVAVTSKMVQKLAIPRGFCS